MLHAPAHAGKFEMGKDIGRGKIEILAPGKRNSILVFYIGVPGRVNATCDAKTAGCRSAAL